jgi:putative Mg2+ transporter-C (MgtC) family protein
VTQITRITLRLLVAAALGGLLGYEREQQGKSAGVRTHMLVAIGAALFVLIPQQAGASTADISRVLQGLIAGVGFLGAGAIILGTKQVETRGLTTAAGIWVTAAIGVAAGMGRESTAVLSTLVALFVFSVVPWILRAKRKVKSEADGKAKIPV